MSAAARPSRGRRKVGSREVAVLFDAHRGVWEVWHQSTPVAESRDRARVVEWAVGCGYIVVEPSEPVEDAERAAPALSSAGR